MKSPDESFFSDVVFSLTVFLTEHFIVYGYNVALLFYVHGKHLRSCRDRQLT